MRLLGLALFVNDFAPTAVFIWLYHRYQPGRHGWRASETGQQMMAMAGVLAGLLLLSIVATLAPMVGWVRALVVVLAAGGHLLLAGVLWWRVRLLIRAHKAGPKTGSEVDHYETRGAMDNLSDRHPATTGLLRYFEYDHLPERLQAVSRPCAELAHEMAEALPDGPELTTGLRKLLEAKDCFVRAALDT